MVHQAFGAALPLPCRGGVRCGVSNFTADDNDTDPTPAPSPTREGSAYGVLCNKRTAVPFVYFC